MNRDAPSRRRDFVRLAGVAAAYFAAHELAFFFPAGDRLVMAIWPAAGVGLAAFLLSPRRLWPGLAAVLFVSGNAANVIGGRPLAASAGFMTANVVESLASAWLIVHWCGEGVRFLRVREVLALLAAAVGLNAGTALIGAGTVSILGASDFWPAWWTWWVADGLGLLLVAPLIVVWSDGAIRRSVRWPWPRVMELAALLFVLGLAAWLVLSVDARQRYHIPPQPAALIVLLIWAALRFGRQGATAIVVLFAVVMANSDAVRQGPLLWGGESFAERLLLAQTYLAVVTVAGLLLAAGSAENESARASILALARRHEILLATGSDGIHVLDDEGNVVEANAAFCRSLGYSREEALRLNVADFVVQKSREEVMAHLRELLGRGAVFEGRHRRKDGTLVDLEVNAAGVTLEGRRYLYASCRDVTARQQAAAALQETQTRLTAAMDRAHLAEWDMDAATETFTFNDRFYALYGTTAEREGGYRMAARAYAREFLPSEEQPIVAETVAALLSGESREVRLEHRIRRRDGQLRHVVVRITAVRDAAGRVVGTRGANQDITDLRLAELALAQNEARLRRAERVAGIGNWQIDLVTGEVAASANARKIYGLLEGKLALADIQAVPFPEDRPKLDAAFRLLTEEGRPYDVQFQIRRATDGQILEIRSLAEFDRPSGTIFGVIHDITAQKAAEAALRTSLLEKEALLREVHHRVKNNLQVITSLLRLESGRSAQPDTKSVLGEMQGRIRSMALLHESLYRAGSFAAVDLGFYLRQIATQAIRSSAAVPGVVDLRLDLASVEIELDQAMPCGLLINELVSNCLKHGFPEGRRGEVRIELRGAEDGPQLRLAVSDDGVGLPADFSARREQTLGLQLVADLARQLGGQLEVGPAGGAGTGASFAVHFIPGRPTRDRAKPDSAEISA